MLILLKDSTPLQIEHMLEDGVSWLFWSVLGGLVGVLYKLFLLGRED